METFESIDSSYQFVNYFIFSESEKHSRLKISFFSGFC